MPSEEPSISHENSPPKPMMKKNSSIGEASTRASFLSKSQGSIPFKRDSITCKIIEDQILQKEDEIDEKAVNEGEEETNPVIPKLDQFVSINSTDLTKELMEPNEESKSLEGKSEETEESTKPYSPEISDNEKNVLSDKEIKECIEYKNYYWINSLQT
eukprot:CAMPEP_0205806114 /NCGR_PEP_ID=MMETSP0205-20121125/9539_1 /ASSEMBLY_ACC=CAM_ASM_000278 /TAXON_ID=36767 /ORGANISM="Euplotes focardii, Strain TN1" /LENGTH=157 /DNA_ID=CAMNT_0053078411 /DNA_START=681 /DNA_END=1150 /DNA_ORIENTATION=-